MEESRRKGSEVFNQTIQHHILTSDRMTVNLRRGFSRTKIMSTARETTEESSFRMPHNALGKKVVEARLIKVVSIHQQRHGFIPKTEQRLLNADDEAALCRRRKHTAVRKQLWCVV